MDQNLDKMANILDPIIMSGMYIINIEIERFGYILWGLIIRYPVEPIFYNESDTLDDLDCLVLSIHQLLIFLMLYIVLKKRIIMNILFKIIN